MKTFCPNCLKSDKILVNNNDETILTCRRCSNDFDIEDTVCPEYEDENSVEPILAWAKANVEYNAPDAHTFFFPAYWQLSWSHGSIALSWLNEVDEKFARLEAAMFIYLWTTGVPASLCSELISFYSHGLKELEKRHGNA